MKRIRHLFDISDFTTDEIDALIAVAEDIMAHREKYAHACEGKKIATLFFEPSTRTRLSFEAAMLELGGTTLGFASASDSSTTKGESVMDTIRTVGAYADIIAMRHPLEGAALAASQRSIVPVVNAGDGGHCHPTQTLADLLTIKNRHGRLDHLTVGICGDLKYGRTVHSLINALSRYPGNRFVMISPPELTIPNYVRYEILEPRGAEWSECRTIEGCIADLDVLYMTRIQRERFSDLNEYERLKDSYVLNAEKMKAAKPDMSVLHPLPRVKEINVDVDDDPRACYFKQVEYGKFMRMSLILKLLADSESGDFPEPQRRPLADLGDYKSPPSRPTSGRCSRSATPPTAFTAASTAKPASNAERGCYTLALPDCCVTLRTVLVISDSLCVPHSRDSQPCALWGNYSPTPPYCRVAFYTAFTINNGLCVIYGNSQPCAQQPCALWGNYSPTPRTVA